MEERSMIPGFEEVAPGVVAVSDYVIPTDAYVIGGMVPDGDSAVAQLFLIIDFQDSEEDEEVQRLTVALDPWTALKLAVSVADGAVRISEAAAGAAMTPPEEPVETRAASPYM